MENISLPNTTILSKNKEIVNDKSLLETKLSVDNKISEEAKLNSINNRTFRAT